MPSKSTTHRNIDSNEKKKKYSISNRSAIQYHSMNDSKRKNNRKLSITKHKTPLRTRREIHENFVKPITRRDKMQQELSSTDYRVLC